MEAAFCGCLHYFYWLIFTIYYVSISSLSYFVIGLYLGTSVFIITHPMRYATAQ